MKKIIAIIGIGIIGVISFARTSNSHQLLKYVTKAPDGSVAMTITDDTREDSMKVESADVFYKYQIVDQKTSETLYTSKNAGKDCIIDKTNLDTGTYDLRLYTSDFVITTDLEILRLGEFYASLKHSTTVAVIED